MFTTDGDAVRSYRDRHGRCRTAGDRRPLLLGGAAGLRPGRGHQAPQPDKRETAILAADRAAAVEQSTQLSQQLDATRNELDSARAEIERLRGELRVLSGPPDSVASMNDRLQVMLRLARDEFGGCGRRPRSTPPRRPPRSSRRWAPRRGR
jgi:hypothetical protein